MPCGGFDIHSPFLFVALAGLCAGAAVSSLIRSMGAGGKRRNRTVAGLYLYLTVFFAVILAALLLVDIPSLYYSHALPVMALISVGLGFAAATWKKRVGGILGLVLIAAATFLTLYTGDRYCGEMEEPLLDYRILSVSDEGVELEVLDGTGEARDYERIETGGAARGAAAGISIRYTRTVFPEWMFFPRARHLFRLEDIGPMSDNGGEGSAPFMEALLRLMPFVQVTDEALAVAEPERLARYRVAAEDGELFIEKVER